MSAAAATTAAEQRRLWARYAERLRDLEGPAYDAAEADAWDELQAALRALGLPDCASDHPSV